MQECDLKTLWYDYGIVGDVMVSLHFYSNLNLLECIIISSQPFTSGFPRAEIYELLSPDLLHQIIKGTFKDHLVLWVEQYLIKKHGATGAAKIMADIDRR